MDGNVELKEIGALPVLAIRFRTNLERIGEDLGKAYGSIFSYLGELGEGPAGMPLTLYHYHYEGEFDPTDIDMEAAVPTSRVLQDRGDIEAKELPGGLVASAMHRGPYNQAFVTYQEIDAWAKENGYRYAGPPREIYYNDPSQVEPSELLTEIQFPVTK
jgi:effector-binding domain-containing protein